MLYILTLFFLIVQSTEAKYGWAWNPPVMVRDEPYLSGDFVAWLEDDSTRVKILSVCGMDSSWYYIELPNGKRGYVPRKRIITAPKEEYFRQLKQELYSLAQPIDPETILVVNPIKIYQQIDYKQLQCDTGISIPLHSQVVLVGIYGKYYLAKWGNFQGFVNKFGTNSIANQSLYVQSLSLNLRARPTTKAPVVAKLEINDELTPIAIEGNWVKVKYGNKEGWVLLKYVSAEAVPAARARRLKFVSTHRLSQKHRELILKGSICIGMTKDEVKASWGEPDDINRTITRWGVEEQWIYGNTYLYFENNKLTTIQEW